MHTFDVNTQEAVAGRSLKFQVSLVYIVSSRPVRILSQKERGGGTQNLGDHPKRRCMVW